MTSTRDEVAYAVRSNRIRDSWHGESLWDQPTREHTQERAERKKSEN